MLTPEFHQLQSIDRDALIDEARAGLLQRQARVAPKFFYDEQGSRLFDAITALDEYYPTRTEQAIVARHLDDIAAQIRSRVATGFDLIDLGAGDCVKASRLFAALQPARYLALDISVEFLRAALLRLQIDHPQLALLGVGLDFSARLNLPAALRGGPALVFYPGSSIGNFDPPDAVRLLREARDLCRGGALLIGVDLVKSAAVLEAAYDDALGVTAAFNLNLLRHLNRFIGSDFDPRQWQHLARYDERLSRIEMHLVARQPLVVRWAGAERPFAAGERIHTENSYKWTPAGFDALLRDAGWRELRHWHDEQQRFALVLASG